jgi:hypothetical protein
MPQLPPPRELTAKDLVIQDSDVHGRGTFALTYLGPNSWFEYKGHRFTSKKWLDILHRVGRDTYVIECGEQCWIDGNPVQYELPEDYDMFGAMINEPPQDFPPNCEFVLSWDERRRRNRVIVVTLIPIVPGFELYANYGSNHKY